MADNSERLKQVPEELTGYASAYRHIARSVSSDHLSHAYIIEGARGAGKKTFGAGFAMALLCQHPVSGKPCGSCGSCRLFLSGAHPDLKWIIPDEKGNISVQQIRSELIADLAVLPYYQGRKVYLIDQAHKLNASAQNALLKTIEEPPEYGVIFLLTENRSAFLPTVLSRSVTISLKPLETAQVNSILTERYLIPADKAAAAAAFCDGSVGRALEMCSSEEFIQRVERWLDHLQQLPQAGEAEVLAWSAELEKEKDHLDEVLRMMLIWFRDIVIFTETKNVSQCFCIRQKEEICSAARWYTVPQLCRTVAFLEDAAGKLAHNVNFALWSDWLLIGLYQLTRSIR